MEQDQTFPTGSPPTVYKALMECVVYQSQEIGKLRQENAKLKADAADIAKQIAWLQELFEEFKKKVYDNSSTDNEVTE